MLVLGLDTGLTCMGMAKILVGKDYKIIECSTVAFPKIIKDISESRRLEDIYSRIEAQKETLQNFTKSANPSIIGIESAFFRRNIKTYSMQIILSSMLFMLFKEWFPKSEVVWIPNTTAKKLSLPKITSDKKIILEQMLKKHSELTALFEDNEITTFDKQVSCAEAAMIAWAAYKFIENK